VAQGEAEGSAPADLEAERFEPEGRK